MEPLLNALTGFPATLDGTRSYDAENDLITFRWSLVQTVQDSRASLQDPSHPKPTFTPDLPGTYLLQLIVSDGKADSLPAPVTVRAFGSDAPPNARAGRDRSVVVGTTAEVDGSASFDPQHHPLSFKWSIDTTPAGSHLTGTSIMGASGPTCRFVPDVAGAYVLRLRVDNGIPGGTDEDTVEVRALLANVPPVADAGPDQTARSSAEVHLDGTASVDADGAPGFLTYEWTLSARPLASALTTGDIANAGTPTATVSPDVLGPYLFRLRVDDGSAADEDNVLIEILPNRPPVAQDDSATTMENTPVTVDALDNDSDPDGDVLSVTNFGQGANGVVRVDQGRFLVYAPHPGFLGTDSFQYTISDGRGGVATATVRVTVTATGGEPTVTGVNVTGGGVGDVVVISGTNLGKVTHVTFGGIQGRVISATGTSITVMVPIGARSGPLVVETDTGSATSPAPFSVQLRQDFTLVVSPMFGRVVQGGSTAFVIEVTRGAGDHFTGLAALSVTGLPAGVTAVLSTPTVTGGQRALLTVTSSTTASIGASTFAITATASSEVGPVTRPVTASIDVRPGGRTVLVGRFTLRDGTPMAGIRLTLGSLNTQTDAGGNFQFVDTTAGDQPLSIDATPVNPGLPIYAVNVSLTSGQITALPTFQITMPPPSEQFVPISNATQNQVVQDARFPGFSLTLPAGVTITGWDGTPKNKIAVERLTVDQLAVPPPPFTTNSVFQIFFGTPMGGVPSAPLPVTLPNDQELLPGEQAEIWYYDAAPFVGVTAGWRLAGLGTVSGDGSALVSNPGVGLSRFCGVCGATCLRKLQNTQPNRNTASPTGGDPVDLALGQMVPAQTDLVVQGRPALVVRRIYNPYDPFSSIAGFQGRLGPGWTLPFDVVLLDLGPVQTLVLPGNSRADFLAEQGSTYKNATDRRFAGALLTAESSSARVLRLKDGSVWRFETGWMTGGKPIPGLFLLVQQIDRNGNGLTIQRDSAGQLQLARDSGGRFIAFTVAAGRITGISDPLGRTVGYSYDSTGRLQSVTNAAGSTTSYTYDADGRILTVTDPKGIVYLRNEYNAVAGSRRLLTRQQQADGSAWRFVYRYLNDCGDRTNLDGVTILSTSQARASTRSLEASVCEPRAVTTHLGTTVINPRGGETDYALSQGFTTQVRTPDGRTISYGLEFVRGLVLGTTDSLGRDSHFLYDAAANLTGTVDAAGNERSFTYDPVFNRLTSVRDPLGNTTVFQYDSRGNLVTATEPGGAATTIAYDQFGQPVTITDPLGNITSLVYSPAGDLATIIDALGDMTRRDYDGAGRLIRVTDARGAATRLTYDPLDRLTAITDPQDGLTQFTWDANSNLLTITDARGNTTSHEYDVMDRLVGRIDPLGNADTFAYDPNGNLTRTTDRRGQTTTYTYDAMNRRATATYADGTAATFEYDAVGRLVRASNHESDTLRSYNILDQLVREVTDRAAVAYTYDAAGRRATMTVAGQPPTLYSYDTTSRLTQVVQGPQIVALDHDAAGRRSRLTLPNGVTTDYRYDAASRLVELTYRSRLAPIGNLTYVYDSAGNRVEVGGSFARTLLPDAIPSALYDPANRQRAFGNRAMTYDGAGNVTAILEGASTTILTWDARNRLVALESPGTTGYFAYDPFGRRIIRGLRGSVLEQVHDSIDVVEERGAGTMTTYLRGLTIDETWGRHGTDFFLQDAIGSIVSATTETGSVATSYTYGPFGDTSTTGENINNPFRFSGREDDGTGLYYYRSRYYDPRSMRFVSEDPLRFPTMWGTYAYASNNPLRFVDPLGLTPSSPGRGRSWAFDLTLILLSELVDLAVPSASAAEPILSSGPRSPWQRSAQEKEAEQKYLERLERRTQNLQQASDIAWTLGPVIVSPTTRSGAIGLVARILNVFRSLANIDSEPTAEPSSNPQTGPSPNPQTLP